MAYPIIYTEEALANLETILDYIRADNPTAAERFGIALMNHVDLLKTFPHIGCPVAERDGVRALLHSPIVIYYHVQENPKSIEILRFWHGSRSDPAL